MQSDGPGGQPRRTSAKSLHWHAVAQQRFHRQRPACKPRWRAAQENIERGTASRQRPPCGASSCARTRPASIGRARSRAPCEPARPAAAVMPRSSRSAAQRESHVRLRVIADRGRARDETRRAPRRGDPPRAAPRRGRSVRTSRTRAVQADAVRPAPLRDRIRPSPHRHRLSRVARVRAASAGRAPGYRPPRPICRS